MGLRYGKCTNFGLCTKADTRESQSMPEGAEFVCQECKRPLTAVAGTDNRKATRDPMPMVLAFILLLLAAGGVYYFTGRNHDSGTTRNDAASNNDFKTSSSTSGGTTLLRLSGSNTIGAELVPSLAEAWLTEKGATNVHRESTAAEEVRVTGTKDGAPVRVEIKAHGSATAFTALADGSADIGMASRKIKAAEAADLLAKSLGDLTSNSDERVLGLDGVAVIVNEANNTDSMTIQEVAGIFSGTATGGKDYKVYARDDKSGTYDTFKDRVLGSRSLVAGAQRFEDSKALVAAVAKDINGIGFVGLPYASGAKVLAIAEKGTAALVPNVNTVRTESYPLSRRLYLYVPDNAKPEAREFVRFALSPAGQNIVDKAGFVGQKVDVMTMDKPAKAPTGYLQLMPSADRLTVDFRFRTGSSDLDPKAVDDIKRLTTAMSSQFNGRGIMLVGFADSTGTAASNLQLSKNRAQAVGQQMERQGVTPVSITGFGQELPVADNSTEDGREKNRRVEVWLRK